jgi:hypothetical protein
VTTGIEDDARDALLTFGRRHAAALRLSNDLATEISNIRHVFRVAPDGQLVIEIIVQVVQRDSKDREAFPVRGVTIVASASGEIRYVIPNQEQPPIVRDAGEHAQETRPYEAALAVSAATGNAQPAPWPEPFPRRFRIEPGTFEALFPHLALTGDERELLAHAKRS